MAINGEPIYGEPIYVPRLDIGGCKRCGAPRAFHPNPWCDAYVESE